MVEGVVLTVEEHETLWTCVTRDIDRLHHVPVTRDAHVLQAVVFVHVNLKRRVKITNWNISTDFQIQEI